MKILNSKFEKFKKARFDHFEMMLMKEKHWEMMKS